ncbi:MAG: YlxR family protein [Cellulomonadaceae bacterium]|nr:YlxR family protein [Cellulomonadaceae bacterium]
MHENSRPGGTLSEAASRGHAPVRTCVGCKKRDLRSELLRLVGAPPATPGGQARVVADSRATAPGRGAWIHPDPACVDLGGRRLTKTSALRVDAPLDTTEITNHLNVTGSTPASTT